MDLEKTIRNLVRNHMAGYVVSSKEELHQLLYLLLQKGETVGCGDSATLEQLQVFDFLRRSEYCFLDKHKSGLTSQEKRNLYLQNFSADTFLTGTNAVTENGELFNIDGNGSRVAPMLYGPKQVIVVVGTNKLVASTKQAMERTRQIAAPMDAKRLGKNTPCTKLGKCIDCHHSERICNDFVLIANQFVTDRIKVIFVTGEYGY